MSSHPSLIKELQWLGIDVVSCANNHAYDWGPGGILTNIKHLDEAGMPHAGTGRNLTEARAPVYVDTPKGRVAVISATDTPTLVYGYGARPSFSWTLPMAVIAGEQSPYSNGRPGCNVIRHRMVYTITQEAFDQLRQVKNDLWPEIRGFKFDGRILAGKQDEDSDTVLHFLGTRFILGDSFSAYAITNEEDVEANLKWVRDARRMADWVIVGFHNHVGAAMGGLPPEYTSLFARSCIDAGADVINIHGAHGTSGIEIYQGKPIFYSLGALLYENDTSKWPPYESMALVGLVYDDTPADFYDGGAITRARGEVVTGMHAEAAIAMVSFKGKQLKEIRLYPIDIGDNLPRYQKGRPILAEPGSEISKQLLEGFQKKSAPFETKIEIEDGVEVIRL